MLLALLASACGAHEVEADSYHVPLESVLENLDIIAFSTKI